MQVSDIIGLISIPTISGVCIFLIRRTISNFDKETSSAKQTAKEAFDQVAIVHQKLLNLHQELLNFMQEIYMTSKSTHSKVHSASAELDRINNEMKIQLDILTAHRTILSDADNLFGQHFELIQATRAELENQKKNIKTIIKVLKHNNLLVSEDRSKK